MNEDGFVAVAEVVNCGYCMQGGELEQPPDKECDAEQYIAGECQNERHGHDEQGAAGVGHVGRLYLFTLLAHQYGLPNEEDGERGSEQQGYQTVRDEDDAESEHHKAQEYHRQIEFHAAVDLFGSQMDEERAQDDHQHHRENQQQVAGFGEEVLRHHRTADKDGEGEDNRSYEDGNTGASLLELRRAESFDGLGQGQHYEQAEQRRNDQITKHIEYETGDDWASPFALNCGGIATEIGIVFVAGLFKCTLAVTLGAAEYAQITVLAAEHTLLELLVAGLCVVVVLLETFVGFAIVLAVFSHLFAAALVHRQKVLGVEHTGVAVDLGEGVEHHGLHVGIGTMTGPHYFTLGVSYRDALAAGTPLQGALHAQAVGCHGDAIGHVVFLLQHRRNAAQRLDKTLVTIDFKVHPFDDLVVGHLALVEVLVFLCGLTQRVGDVEGEVLILGIEHQRILIAALYHAHHAVVLLVVTGAHPALEAFHLGVLLVQLAAEHGKGLRKVLLVQDCESGCTQKEGRYCGDYMPA